VDLKLAPKGCVFSKLLDYVFKNILIILGPIVNMIGGLVQPLNEQENLRFDNQ
jgi:hypothetical protein